MGQVSRSRLARIAPAEGPQPTASRTPRLLLPAVEEFRESTEGKTESTEKSSTDPLFMHMDRRAVPLRQELVKGRIAGGLEVAQGMETGYFRRVKIGIKTKGRILLIDPSNVASVEAQGNYALMRRQSDSYLLRASISTLAEQLEPHGFLRVHRSSLVNASWVEELRPGGTGECILLLKGGREYTVSRTYRCNLKRLAQAWIGTDFPNGHGNV
jgi:DNA-binding LytR/AlgR family response regulator